MPRKTTTKRQHLYAQANKDIHGGYSLSMLRKVETNLMAEAWDRSGFRLTSLLAGMPHRWDIIYKALLNRDEATITSPTRGPAMKSINLPDCVAAVLIKNRLSLRQWSNAYGKNEDDVRDKMLEMARLEKDLGPQLDLLLYIERDFPALSAKLTSEIVLPPQNYLKGDVYICQGYGSYLAASTMKSKIKVQAAGESIEKSIYTLKSKAAALTRISSLYYWLNGAQPMLENLFPLVQAPSFSSVTEVDEYRNERKSQGY